MPSPMPQIAVCTPRSSAIRTVYRRCKGAALSPLHRFPSLEVISEQTVSLVNDIALRLR
jgi:hypothetical protein